ncbi:hypothetical protein E3983_11175 [Legionella israelensis]|uniref:Uncharacterized protein n=1 Tax=Legionella israelensis TaxID=454 RepID=A0AAX1EJ87_9GAMM|nr:hypothetical protein [Legionella israelensis]QBR84864.1 hypothetical protein E3983_11175 [Legionella israelensis]
MQEKREDSSLVTDEQLPLITPPKKSIFQNSGKAGLTLVKLITSLPKGAGSWSSTFGPIAIYYKPGLWLIAPVTTGSGISLTHEAVTALAEKNPENKFFKALNKGTFAVEKGISGFLGDFGFAWSTINTLAGYIGGIEYHSNDFARMVAPALAVLPAILTRSVNYKNAQNQLTERSITRHVANTFRGLVAPGGVLGVLLQQEIIDPESPVPSSIILATGIVGLLSSLLKESHPKISKVLSALIEIICENPSLAATFFHFPNDIYAATNDEHEISYGFFFTNVGLSMIFLITLTLFSLKNHLQPSSENQPSNVHFDIETGYSSESEDSEEDEEKLKEEPKIQVLPDVEEENLSSDLEKKEEIRKKEDVDNKDEGKELQEEIKKEPPPKNLEEKMHEREPKAQNDEEIVLARSIEKVDSLKNTQENSVDRNPLSISSSQELRFFLPAEEQSSEKSPKSIVRQPKEATNTTIEDHEERKESLVNNS